MAWGRIYGPDGNVVDGAEALARANVGSLAARYFLDLNPDWESKVAQKFGGFEDIEQYVRRCIVESLQPCTLKAASITAMCGCLRYQSRDCPEWESSPARLFLDRIADTACQAGGYDPSCLWWSYKSPLEQ